MLTNRRLRFGAALAIILGLIIPAFSWAKDYKGVEMITHNTYKYGAVEARIRAAEGSGLITAFFYWKNDSELEWTEWQEQDFEIFGKNGRYQTQVMTPGDPRTENVELHSLPTLAWDKYYTYRMEWTPNYLAFYIDGKLVRKETDQEVFAKLLDPARAEPAQLRLSLWAGDYNWSGYLDTSKLPGATYVEFFQTYTYDESTETFTLDWRDDFDFMDYSHWWFANWTFEYAVNDYVQQNATTVDGKLILTLTTNEMSGQFPMTPPADNPVVEDTETDNTQTDYTPVNIPGRVEAEVISNYYDIDTVNSGDAECGSTGVDAELTADVDGFCNIGWAVAGEWTEYQVVSPEEATYDLTLRVATNRTSKKIGLSIDGEQIGTYSVTKTSWTSFYDLVVPVTLTEGVHVVRVTFTTGDMNLNYLDFQYAEEPEEPVEPVEPGEPVAIPARIEAENFFDSYDLTSGNSLDATCNTGDIDAELTGDVDGFCSIGATEAGEWVEYQVDVAESYNFNVGLRVGTNQTSKKIALSVDGEVIQTITVTKTSWTSYYTHVIPVALTAGTHTVRVTFVTGAMNLNWLEFTATTPLEETEEPTDPVEPTEPGEPVAIPARIEAESFTDFYDLTTGNALDAACGSTDVDIEITSDVDGNCNIGAAEAGEWVEYEVDVAESYNFDLTLRVATNRTGKKIALSVDGEVIQTVSVTRTSWTSFYNIVVPVALTAGTHTVRVTFVTGDMNFNWLEFTATSPLDETTEPEEPTEPVEPTDPGEPVAIPARIEAESFIAYYDSTSGNALDTACGSADVDVEFTGDVEGTCNIGATVAGEWVEYLIDVPYDGDYSLTLRVATNRTSTSISAAIDDASVGSVSVPRKGWQVYTDQSIPVTLTAGTHTLRITFDTGNANLNWVEFTE